MDDRIISPALLCGEDVVIVITLGITWFDELNEDTICDGRVDNMFEEDAVMLVVVGRTVTSMEDIGFDTIPKYEESSSTYSEVLSNNELKAMCSIEVESGYRVEITVSVKVVNIGFLVVTCSDVDKESMCVELELSIASSEDGLVETAVSAGQNSDSVVEGTPVNMFVDIKFNSEDGNTVIVDSARSPSLEEGNTTIVASARPLCSEEGNTAVVVSVKSLCVEEGNTAVIVSAKSLCFKDGNTAVLVIVPSLCPEEGNTAVVVSAKSLIIGLLLSDTTITVSVCVS